MGCVCICFFFFSSRLETRLRLCLKHKAALGDLRSLSVGLFLVHTFFFFKKVDKASCHTSVKLADI